MFQTPEDRRYTAEHAWARLLDNALVEVGITDFAQNALNDVVFAQLPKIGQQVSAGEQICLLESVKSASDVYAPISGTIVAVNAALENAPELLNSDPYGAAWLCQIQADNPNDIAALLDAPSYAQSVA